ncbi:hypothetical protein [Rossellomorea sp. FM04394]|uniref:hypothetical protein n=1 Tax=Rossellomorea sp. FM04394 TaxID=3243076 RepID=UPI0035A5A1DB
MIKKRRAGNPFMFTWKNVWVQPYESILSISEKFKFCNQVSNITEKSMAPFWEEILGDSIENKKAKEDLSIPILGRRILNNFCYPKVRVCPICIKVGYHSYLHQFTLISKCPFHSVELISGCPSCHKQHPYKRVIPNYSLYLCPCGYEFASDLSKLMNGQVSTHTYDLPMKQIRSWLESDLRIKKSVNIFRLNGIIPLELFELIKNDKSGEKFTITTYEYRRVEGISKARLDNIFHSSRKIVSSINRHLKSKMTIEELRSVKLISRNSLSEIKYTRGLTTYLIWKLYINMSRDLRSIENGKERYPIIYEQPKFTAKLYDVILYDLYVILKLQEASEEDIENFLLMILSRSLIFEYNRISRQLPKVKSSTLEKILYGDWAFINDDIFLGVVIHPKRQKVYVIEEIP